MSIVLHSRGVTGGMNLARGCLMGIVIATSVSLAFLSFFLDLLDEIEIQHDRPQRSKKGSLSATIVPVLLVVIFDTLMIS